MMEDAVFEVECDIMPAFSVSVNSFLSQTRCIRGNMYGFWSKGLMLSLGKCHLNKLSFAYVSRICEKDVCVFITSFV